MCNSNSRLGAILTADIYKQFPVVMSDECQNQAKLDEADIEKCVFFWFLCGEALKARNERGDRCSTLRQRLKEQQLGINAHVPAAQLPFSALANIAARTLSSADQALLRADFTVEIDTASSFLSFVPRTIQTVFWSTVALDHASVNGSSAAPALAVSDALFGVPLTFGTTTFAMADGGRGSLSPDLVFGPLLPQSVSNPRGRLVRGGLVMPGCAVPSFTFRVEWHRSTQLQTTTGGRRLLQQQEEVCWRRVTTVTAVRDLLTVGQGAAAEQRRCFMFFSSNTLRRRLSQLEQQPAAASQLAATAVSSPLVAVLLAVSQSARQQTQLYIQNQNWATGILFPEAYAALVLNCAQPAAPELLGGVWFGQNTFSPGICVTCASLYVVHQPTQQRGLQVQACNRSSVNDHGGDCCMGCAPATHMRIDAPGTTLGFVCAERCRKGSAYTRSNGRCLPCASGLYSAGGAGQCITCGALVGDPNAWVDARQGCRVCGSGAQVAAGSAACVPCESGKYVSAGTTVCAFCVATGHVVPPTTAAVRVCVPCPAGTFMITPQRECRLCPQDTFAALEASTACAYCAVGHLSTYNRTACAPCAAINASLMPFAEYFQRGCSLRCAPLVSYVRISPYSHNGCGSCATAVVPVGTYVKATDCTVTPPCTNAPAHNAYYTTASPTAGNPHLCGWACQAGYAVNQSRCDPCVFNTAQYSPARHRATVGCKYTCLPRIYVDPSLSCDKPCLSMADEGRIVARVRGGQPATRPNFIHGVCGTNETLPRAEARFLRLGSWAYLSSAASTIAAQCGNSLLNTGEECDDGNRVAGDGCSAACAVEPGRWECDLIGAPCERDCGWTLTSPAPNGVGLLGFALPPGGDGGCANLSYRYSVVPLSPRDRLAWMQAHLVSCDCRGNAMRVLPYAQCTAANGGCRQCVAGTQYHDDLLARCVECGSVCAPGFLRAYDGRCSSSSSAAAIDTSVDGQLAVGCVACDVPSGPPVRFVRGCLYACTTGSSYCRSTTLNADGVTCPSAAGCGLCDFALSLLLQAARTSGGATIVGRYPRGCSNGAGYVWAPCDPATRPAVGAFWTSDSLQPGASGGCKWQCAETYYAWRGQCLPCFPYTGGPALSCSAGQRLQWCSAADRAACIPCVGALPAAYQAWTSDPPYYAVCRADCEAHVSYRLSPNATECLLCARPQCALGELLVPCTPSSDAACSACANPAALLLEFAAAGSCQTRCVAGHYADPLNVDGCLPCAQLCELGSVSVPPTCDAPQHRLTRPLCLPCPPLQPNQAFFLFSSCDTRCAYGAVAANSSCQPCRPALCGLGYHGACVSDTPATTQLLCTPCAAAPRSFVVPGDCTFLAPAAPAATPSSSATPAAAAAAAARSMVRGGVAHPELPYPNRTRQHSGMPLS